MNTIIISESQYKRLFEDLDFNGGDINEYVPSDEVTTTNNITDDNGEVEYGNPSFNDMDDMTSQNPFYFGRGRI